MIHLKSQLSYGIPLAILTLNLLMLQQSSAELSTVQVAPINNLYDNLLQREYAGPVIFPNHQVERKAQRSPSLRLRFGRSDPDMLDNIVHKRWFGDVNQKPIRSPSLRLRFGRRSDPNLPQMRRTIDDDLIERELTLNNQQMNQAVPSDESELTTDYDGFFDRVMRTPPRLRWGRSVPDEANRVEHDQSLRQQQRDQLQRERQQWQEMTRLLLLLQQQYDNPAENTDENENEDNAEYQFEREARKPARLRWGRSTGKAPLEQKLSLAAETSSVTPKAQN